MLLQSMTAISAISATLNSHMMHTRRRTLSIFGHVDAFSKAKKISRGYSCHYSIAAFSRNFLLYSKRVPGPAIQLTARQRPQLCTYTRPLSTVRTTLSLGRAATATPSAAATSSRIYNSVGSFSSIRHQQPTTSSLAYFTSQNTPAPRPPPNKRSLGNVAGMVGTGALVLFGKTKYVLAALKLTKLAPLGKKDFCYNVDEIGLELCASGMFDDAIECFATLRCLLILLS